MNHMIGFNRIQGGETTKRPRVLHFLFLCIFEAHKNLRVSKNLPERNEIRVSVQIDTNIIQILYIFIFNKYVYCTSTGRQVANEEL